MTLCWKGPVITNAIKSLRDGTYIPTGFTSTDIPPCQVEGVFTMRLEQYNFIYITLRIIGAIKIYLRQTKDVFEFLNDDDENVPSKLSVEKLIDC